MALTKEIKLKSVTDESEGITMLRLVYELVITDDSPNGDGFTKEYTALYKDTDGTTVDQRMSAVINKIVPLMQADINTYKREHNLLNHPKAVESVIIITDSLEI